MNINFIIGSSSHVLDATISDDGDRKVVEVAISDIQAAGIENGLLLGASFSVDGVTYQIVGGLAPDVDAVSLSYLAEVATLN